MGDDPRPGPNRLRVIAAGGGVGTTSIGLAVAREWAQATAGVVFVSGTEPTGLDVALGLESSGGLRWSDLSGARGRIEPDRLVDALPRWERVSVLATAARPGTSVSAAVVREVVTALDRFSGPVVLDLGAALDRAAFRFEEGDERRRWPVVIVAGTGVPTLAVAGALCAEHSADLVACVVRHGRGRIWSTAELADLLGTPVRLLGRDREASPWADRGYGLPPGSRSPIGRTGRWVAARVAAFGAGSGRRAERLAGVSDD